MNNKEFSETVSQALIQRKNETKEQFEFRMNIFNNIYNDLKDSNKALVYSNIWINILSLGCSYPESIMEKVKKYEPDACSNVYNI
jgi:hypothetical protein